MQNLLLAMTLAAVMTSCTKNEETTVAPLPEKTFTNISYGTDARHKLDVYLPANRKRETTGLIIMIHGGGWTSGDKSELSPYVSELKKRLPEYAVANVNYRLATQAANKFPTQENDIKQAVEFLLSKTEEYEISNEVVLLGISAGAHLALLQAYKHDDVIKPRAVVSFFAPTDMADMYNNPVNTSLPLLLQILVGGSPTSNPQAYAQSSPVTFVDQNTSPTLILHGEKDNLVNVRQARMLKSKLEAANVPHQLVLYPNEGHGWSGETLQDSFEKVVSFISKHSK